MFSFAVLNNLYKGVFFAVVLLFGASFEELLPRVAGVGFPLLMMCALCLVRHRALFSAALLALAAGAVEDSISSLPPMTSASFFLIAAYLVRYVEDRLPIPALAIAAFAFPIYQIWLAVWSVSSGGAVFLRILVSLPFGAATAAMVFAAVGWMERKAAVDDQV